MCNYDCHVRRGRQRFLAAYGSGCRIMNESLSLVQTFIGVSTSETSVGHAGGAATILKCRGTRPAKNEIEKKVLLSLRGPVVS